MTSLQDRIVSVFLDKQTRELKDAEVSIALVNQGIPCTAEDVRRHVQLLSPALFQLIFNDNKTVTIRLEPTIEICQQFLDGRCQAEAKSCNKLHICRHIEGCRSQKCGFPHDFTKGYNQKIVTENHCQNINPVLLVKLLRLKGFSSRPPFARGHRGARGGRGGNRRGRGRRLSNQVSSRNFPVQKNDPDRQVDVSFPSSNLAKQIDMEIIGMLLNLRNLKIEDKFNENENEYCRRGTIQFERINDVEKLLTSPVLHHHNFDIKFKRTKQIIDKTSFILKTSINNEQDKIDPYRLNLYTNTLVPKDLLDTISDLSSDSEQIMLIQCKHEIDFVRVCQAHKTKSQLANKHITLIQIYECDALEIRYNDENKSISENDVKQIFESVWVDIFAYNFPSDGCAEVEFINANAFRQWMSTIDSIQNKFNVTINPIIDNVDENNDDVRSTTSNESDSRSRPTTIKISSDWTLIAAHPKFKLQFKEFIHNEFGGEIDIKGDEVTYNGTFPNHPHGSKNEDILGNKTTEFMKRFQCKTFHKLDQHHLEILKTNSATVAFSRKNENDYVVATKSHEMPELKRKLFAKTNHHSQPEQPYPLMHPSSNLTSRSLPVTSSVTSMYSVSTREQMSMFTIDTFEDRLRQYLQETFNIKIICDRYNNEKTKGIINTGIRIKITGKMNDVENAIQDVENLFSSLCTKKFDDKTDGNWTTIAEAAQVIEHHFKLANLICTCQQISPTTVHVYYFHITNPQFGTDEQKIEDLIKDQFRTATIPYNPQSISSKFMKDWTNFEENIRQRNDYKQNICLSKDSNIIYLFGLPDLVKEFRQKFEQLKHKYNPQPCKITLSERQLNYLKYVARADMIKLEKQYKSDGCDVSLTRLRQSCEFIAPSDMHSKIKDNIQAIAQIREISFDIDNPGFEILVSKEPERLISLVESKCFLEKTIETLREHISIPKARVADLEDGFKPTASASALPNVTSVNIGHSTVTISIGDLTAQAVDVIVACSSSEYLCKEIVEKAGAQVKKEYATLKSSDQFPGKTSNGALPCKKIFFVPWSSKSHNAVDVKSSLSSFISIAFTNALSEGYKSIAFPAVGCGKLNFDPSMIAKYMLRETRDQLKTSKIKMNISFILQPNNQNVYDAFVARLNEMETIDLAISHKIPTRKKDDQSTITYDRKIIKITLISSNDHHLIKCKEDILHLARSFSTKSQLTNKRDMLDWPQNIIYKYYDYCLKQRVIPTLDFDQTTVELIGGKDAVHEAEKYFYELSSEIFKQQHIHAVSRGVIWSVELTKNSDTWEQYSFKLNGIIEDACSKNHPHVDFENDKEEKCRIIFATMEEHCSTKIRRIRRKLVDSILPKSWVPSDQNCKRVPLNPSSEEYQTVLTSFHVTMLGKYLQILKIERIENERWYKQYAAHRDDFQRRYGQTNERLLFHGCPSTSADLIIEQCFNRSFAGINGVVYGCGVYFHVQASYSHQYAHANSSGERTMFLARVLVGKSCKGDKSMKVVPPGYDTTTDGQYIFVVYHDAGAYADHLITYK